MNSLEDMLLAAAALALFAPLGMAMLLAFVAPLRARGKPAAWLSVAAALVSLAASLFIFAFRFGAPPLRRTVAWLPQEGLPLAEVGLALDGVSAGMLVVVTFVASMVQVFSLGYMAEEPPPSQGRYFTYHSLFIFSMNLLVLAPNLLQLFLGWELVGLTSYLLIGFYYQKPSAGHAAVKAFWVTKFADMGLLLGLLVLFAASGSFGFDTRLGEPVATAVTLLAFLAVMGKSAQFPLHIWLPNAMEGPTPVSALLHAATMVAAGVYLLVRIQPLLVQAPSTQEVLLWVGSFTALFAAVVAVVQTDIKRVLAYSTCSQLGYMVAALGAGATLAGYFHLTTHAFFKALLFLAAGSVIHAVRSNELSDMGGLYRTMPLTTGAFLVGACALAGIPGFSGFFSKDLILEALAERGAWLPLTFLLAAAFMTAFYMGRVVLLAFIGRPSKNAPHAHESGPSMTIPLLLLALPALGAGWFAGAFAEGIGLPYRFHLGPVGAGAALLAFGGAGLSYVVYGSRAWSPQGVPALAALGALARSGAVDRAASLLFHRVALRIAAGIGWFDRYVIDGVMNWLGWASMITSRRLQLAQTGNVLDYVFAVAAGVVVLAAWRLWT